MERRKYGDSALASGTNSRIFRFRSIPGYRRVTEPQNLAEPTRTCVAPELDCDGEIRDHTHRQIASTLREEVFAVSAKCWRWRFIKRRDATSARKICRPDFSRQAASERVPSAGRERPSAAPTTVGEPEEQLRVSLLIDRVFVIASQMLEPVHE